MCLGEKSLTFESLGESSTTSHDVNFTQHHSNVNAKPTHIPTPPPRSKNVRHHRDKCTTEKKSFESLHSEFGAKILKDQEKRWALAAESGKSMIPQTQLSVLRQNSLIEL